MAPQIICLTLKTPKWNLEQLDHEKKNKTGERHVEISTNCVFYKISDYEHTVIITGTKGGISVKETPLEIMRLIEQAEHIKQ